MLFKKKLLNVKEAICFLFSHYNKFNENADLDHDCTKETVEHHIIYGFNRNTVKKEEKKNLAIIGIIMELLFTFLFILDFP